MKQAAIRRLRPGFSTGFRSWVREGLGLVPSLGVKVFRRIPPPDPDARARALARLTARPASHAHPTDKHLHTPHTAPTTNKNHPAGVPADRPVSVGSVQADRPVAAGSAPADRPGSTGVLTDSAAGGVRADRAVPASGVRVDRAVPASGVRADRAVPASGMRADRAVPGGGVQPRAEDLEERDEVRGGWIPEQPSREQPSPEQPSPEQLSTEHPRPGQPSTEHPRPGQPSTRRLRDARWTLTPRHIAVLAVVLAIGLTWIAWTFLRARPEPVPETHPTTATTGTPVAQPTTTQPQAASAQSQPGTNQTPGIGQMPAPGSASAQPRVVVHVAGKVRRPGLVRAPAGSRIADVLTLAGGPLRGVDLTSLNLARQVTDGEQIIVGQPATSPPTNQAPSTTTPSPTTAPGTPGTPGTPVNLNTATLAQLDALPGVGPVLAQRILDYRTQNGPFTTIDQLQEVPGVGPKKFDSLKPHVRT